MLVCKTYIVNIISSLWCHINKYELIIDLKKKNLFKWYLDVKGLFKIFALGLKLSWAGLSLMACMIQTQLSLTKPTQLGDFFLSINNENGLASPLMGSMLPLSLRELESELLIIKHKNVCLFPLFLSFKQLLTIFIYF